MIERIKASNLLISPKNQHQEQNLLNKETNESSNKEMNFFNEEKVTKNSTKELVDNLNKFLNPIQTSLHFELHEKLNEYYVTIVDSNTKEIVREIPPKKLLDIYAALAEQLGLIVDKKI